MALLPIVCTATVENGSDLVEVSGTDASTGAAVVLTDINCRPNATVFLGGVGYLVAERVDTTSFRIERDYAGADASGVSCTIAPFTPEMANRAELATNLRTYSALTSLLQARGNGLHYLALGSTGSGDPGAGQVSYVGASWAAATALCIDVLDAVGRSRAGLIDRWANGDTLIVESIATAAYVAYELTEPPSEQGSGAWYLLEEFALVAGDGALVDGEALRLVWLPVGAGEPGASAYDIAVANGFVGDEAAWLASLDGADGTDGTNGVDGKFSGAEIIKTAAYTATAADVGKTIILDKATADTLSFQPAATLGSTWMAIVKNIGAGTWTLDPDGAETIDGAATLSLLPGQSCAVSSNGTLLKSYFTGGIGGSTGSTDNRLLRADGAGGTTVQASAIAVDDSGNISGVGTIAAGGQISVQAGVGSATLQLDQYDNSAPTAGALVQRRSRGTSSSPSAVQSGDTIAGINARGYGSTGFSSLGRATFSFRAAEAWTDSAQGTDFAIETTAIGGTSRASRLTVQLGLLMAGASGGDKGAGTINATAVYDDNSLLTCVALQTEFLERGEIDLPKWDTLAPDVVEPERREEVQVTWPLRQVRARPVIELDAQGRLVRRIERVEETVEVPAFIADPVYDEGGNIVDAVETPLVDEVVIPQRITKRVHRTARLFKAMIDDGFDPRDPEQYFAKLRADEALPGMPTKADWEHNTLSMGEQFSRKWLAMEMLAIVANVMWIKLKEHETRIAALETRFLSGP